MDKTIVLLPRLSEKTYAVSQLHNVYVFDVPNDSTKHTVARGVEAQFGVGVAEVNIVNVKGKVKRTVRKGGRGVQGQRSDLKKAYVTLKDGDKLPFFDEPEDKDAKKAEKKADKKADAKAKKESK
ncbi:MAG TPA: 50S ribosomal protein L23 [Candidatus Saccharimonadales bacterium]